MHFAVFGMIVVNAAWREVKRIRGDAAMTEFANLFSALDAPRASNARRHSRHDITSW